MDIKKHWESIYQTKKMTEVSWYQPVPETSLEFIKGLHLSKDARIIDIGGGDSFVADFLLMEGYTNITVLDISEEALNRVQSRLGDRAGEIKWITADVAEFTSEEKYDLWHDRAAFHFLTEDSLIQGYLDTLGSAVCPGGNVILATFSENGPENCSGLEVKRYSVDELTDLLRDSYERLSCSNTPHETPSGSIQEFSFCSFRKI